MEISKEATKEAHFGVGKIKRRANRKRQRRSIDIDQTPTDVKLEEERGAFEKECNEVNVNEPINCSKRQRRLDDAGLPLKGKIVALSSALKNAVRKRRPAASATSTQPDDTSSCLSYQELAAMCHSAGAKVAGMVHKRVFCVIVTDAAAAQHTQRIRKAQKYGIPIVHVTWLEDCLSQRHIVPFQLVEFEAAMATTCERNTDAKDSGKETIQDQCCVTEGRTIHLGCCCVCHDEGTRASCQWCIDCNYES